MTDILVVGGGGREHAVVAKLRESAGVGRIYCAPGNGGIVQDAECVPIAATDVDDMVRFAREKQVGLTVVTPDDPLAKGMVDALEAAGVRAFGPCRRAAAIESSKAFAKGLMRRYGIPTAGYEIFDDPAAAMAYIRRRGRYPVVVKADGLALGKGVIVASNEREAAAAVHSLMEERVFGASGSRVVIEEFLTGPEVSVLSFTDGRTLRPMVSSKDHKRACDGDRGPNTGGMGAISPNLYYTDTVAKECMERIFLPTMEAMNREGRPFKGCLYFGLMLTPDGPKVIEYNARFGDPETQVVLPRLQSDFLAILEAVVDGHLDAADFRRDGREAACVVAASGGYPRHYETGRRITGLEDAAALPDVRVFHAGTRRGADGAYETAGGRVLDVTALGETREDALRKAYAGIGKIHFDGMQFRRDIGR